VNYHERCFEQYCICIRYRCFPIHGHYHAASRLYVFERHQNFAETNIISTSNFSTGGGQEYGRSVEISRDVAIVGVPGDDEREPILALPT